MKRHKHSWFFGLTIFAIVFVAYDNGATASSEGSAILNSDALQGQYVGYLPCADCPGIEYTLWLKKEGTYTGSLLYTDRSDQPTVQSGTYTIEGNIVVLDKKDAGLKYFAPHPQGLQVLDINGKPIVGSLSQRYLLTRKAGSSDAMLTNETLMLMRKKFDEGIGFYALGNEPFWSLDIDFDKGMRFTSLTELSEMNTPPGRENKAQDADVTRFFAQTDAGTLIATVMRFGCADTMADVRFPFKVRVDVKREADSDYTSFEGCGRYVMDPRLNDIWVLTRFGDRPVAAQEFQKGLPVLEFHLNDNQVIGSTGCNQISGRFEARADKITMRYFRSTRMACPDMTFEQEFLSTITDRTMRYTINKRRLVLSDDNGMVMVLKKTD